MPALEDTRLETLARGAGAGFAETEGAGRGEVAAPDRDEAAAESRRGQLIAAVDLAPVIVQLMDLATQAGDLGTPAAMNAARAAGRGGAAQGHGRDGGRRGDAFRKDPAAATDHGRVGRDIRAKAVKRRMELIVRRPKGDRINGDLR